MSPIARRLPFAAGLAVLLVGFASAPGLAQGTPEQRAACTGDAMRLCSADVPDVAKITACLRRERAQLSAACQLVMRQGEPTEVASNAPMSRRVR